MRAGWRSKNSRVGRPQHPDVAQQQPVDLDRGDLARGEAHDQQPALRGQQAQAVDGNRSPPTGSRARSTPAAPTI